MDVAILLYGLGAMNLVGVLAAGVGHFVVGWLYLVLGCLSSPGLDRTVPRNPFGPARGNPVAGRPQE
jgi:hypothetical protein